MADKTDKEVCIDAAERWEALAKSAENMAAWNRDRGFDLSLPGNSVGDRNAVQYRQCAASLRLKAETGLDHCMCHLVPAAECPFIKKM